jgi:uncharacterized RDD family membrane protein YckC
VTPIAPSTDPAGLGRRVGALAIDWAIASFISAGFFGYDSLATLGVFAVMTAILVGTVGSTIGHRLVGIGVRRLDGGASGPGRAVVRTLGLCLVIPAVVWGDDGRGLHDRWAGTTIVRLSPARAARR